MSEQITWHSRKESIPQGDQWVLIRETYRSLRSGRFTSGFTALAYFGEFSFTAYEKAHRSINLKITHWLPIPPLKL